MVFSPHHVCPCDPVGCMFDLCRLSYRQRDKIGAGLSLLLSWSRLGRWPPEGCVSAYRQFMVSAVPLHATTMTVAPVDTAQLHDAMQALRQGKQTTAQWASHRDSRLLPESPCAARRTRGRGHHVRYVACLGVQCTQLCPYHPGWPRWGGVPRGWGGFGVLAGDLGGQAA